MKMANNENGDDYYQGRNSAPNDLFAKDSSTDDASIDLNTTTSRPMSKRRNSIGTKQTLESPHSININIRLTPTSTISNKTNLSRKPTFFHSDSHHTPGTIIDDSPLASRKLSMTGKNIEARKIKTCKSISRRATSADSLRGHENKKRSNQTPPENESMQSIKEAQLEKFKEAFQIFDHDGDGRITRAEMVRAMRSLGYPPCEEEVTDMLERADINHNGTIEFEEFMQMMTHTFPSPDDFRFSSLEQDLQAMFEIFDLNKDGHITAQELSYVMRTLGENLSKSELDDMMKTADANGDGIIDFQEFENMFRLYDQSFNDSRTTWTVRTH